MRSIIRGLLVVLSFTLLLGGNALAQTRRRSVRATPPAPERQVTTFEVIDRAVAEDRISEDQATLYKVFASYGDARLPQELRGDDTGIGDSVFMSEVAGRYESLPVDLQRQIAPFLIPPFHQNSWWSLRNQAKAQASPSLASTAIASTSFGVDRPCTDCPLSLDWDYVATANGKVKVWYHESNLPDAVKAQFFANEIDNVIWPRLKTLMGREPLPDDGDSWLGAAMGGDARLDIALVDIDRSVTTARFSQRCNAAAWAYIQFNDERPVEELAHELMHAFQYAFNVKVRGGDCTGEDEYRWLMESTAEWVKDFIYPSSASPHNEHWAPQHFLGDPESSLNERSDPHWYGAYLFPFFLARVKGQPEIVGRIWANTEQAASLLAVEQALQPLGGFEKVWPEFALRNWNGDPVDDYQKLDQMKSRPKERGDTFLTGGAVDKYAPLGVELPHLSATYKHFVFNDKVRSVAFLNGLTYKLSTTPRVLHDAFDLGLQYQWETIPAEQKRGASIQAIVKRNGKWEQPEDWTDVPYKPFCRQKPEENIEEIVLIIANANFDETSVLKIPGLAPLVIATDMGCRWEGSLEGEASTHYSAAVGPFKIKYDLTREPRDPMETKDFFLGYFYNTSGHASWSSVGAAGPCSVNAHNDNAPMRTDLESYSINFAPQTSKGYRKSWMPMGLSQEARYPMNCVVGTVEANASLAWFPHADPLMLIPTNPGGGLLGNVSDLIMNWKWDFKPKP